MIAAPPEALSPPESAPPERSPAWLLDRLGPLLLLACAGVVLEIGWLGVWTVSYRLTHGNDFTFTYLVDHPAVWERLYDLLVLGNTLVPGLEPPVDAELVVNVLVAAFAIASIGYLASLVLLDRGLATAPGALGTVLGLGLVYQATLLTLPGLFTTDVFSYMMYGHISAIYGLNPYIYVPADFPGNPLVGQIWIHPIWHHQPSVYGPLWTAIGWAMARLTYPLGLVEQAFAYKLLMNALHLVNLALVWWLLGRFAGRRPDATARLTAFTLFAWNPLVLFEVAGNAHNDGLMVTLLLLALVPLAAALPRGVAGRAVAAAAGAAAPGAGARHSIPNRAWLLSLVGVGLSALVKYTTGLAGLFFAVAWVRQLPTWRARAAWVGSAGLLVAGLTLVLFWPWMELPEAVQPMLDAAGGQNYTNSLPDLAALTIADQVLDPGGLDRAAAQETARFWSKVATRGLFALYLLWEMRRLWRLGPAPGRAVVEAVVAASARAFLVLLLLVLTWVLTWYFLWPLALATLLGWRSTLTRVVVGYTLTSLPVFYIHHYWNVHMPGWLLFVYALPPLLVPLLARWLDRRAELPPVAAWHAGAPAGPNGSPFRHPNVPTLEGG